MMARMTMKDRRMRRDGEDSCVTGRDRGRGREKNEDWRAGRRWKEECE